MKLKLLNIILILTLFSCQNNQTLDGNYSICHNEEYTEIYFEKDSMRIASDNEWIKLSEWRKIEIKNNTLNFMTFGEWKDSSKAKIKYVGNNKIELQFLKNDEKLDLELIDEDIKFENLKEFWNGFRNRKKFNNCK